MAHERIRRPELQAQVARRGRLWMATAAAAWLALPAAAMAQEQDRMLLYDKDGLKIRGHLQLGLNAVAENDVFWNFSETFAPGSGFDPDPRWLEGYIKGGFSFTRDFGTGTTVYGKLTGVASGTLGIDAFNAGNTGRVTLEEAYLGLRQRFGDDLTTDISVGPREFVAGTGMLIANGGSSGFERGALKLGPRKAWEQAALGTVKLDRFTATGFYLDANEIPDTDSGTEIAGFDLRFDYDKATFAGGTFGHVLASDAPYPTAPPPGGLPGLLPGGRDGLNFVNLYARGNPFGDRLGGFFIGGDFAYEWNERIDMTAWAGRAQIGYTFEETSWTPTISYTYQTFSGDDPSTAALERFDPLYYQGNPDAWSTGTKSSMLFLNSNVNAHQIMLRVRPTQVDTVTFRYAHISANELNSPIQFGQGTRLDFTDGSPGVVTGVTDRHLSDDLFLEYNRVLTPNLFLTAGVGVAIPGRGIKLVTRNVAPFWPGAFVNIVANF